MLSKSDQASVDSILEVVEYIHAYTEAESTLEKFNSKEIVPDKRGNVFWKTESGVQIKMPLNFVWAQREAELNELHSQLFKRLEALGRVLVSNSSPNGELTEPA